MITFQLFVNMNLLLDVQIPLLIIITVKQLLMMVHVNMIAFYRLNLLLLENCVMDQMETITGELEKDWLAHNSGYSIFNPEFYIKYNNIIPEQFIFKLTNEKNRFKSYGEKEEKKKEKNIFDFIESNQNLNEVAKVNVSNNKLILFNNNSLTTKNPKLNLKKVSKTKMPLKWHPQGDSNPCCRDENPVS